MSRPGLNVTSVSELAGVRDRFLVGCEDCASHIIPDLALIKNKVQRAGGASTKRPANRLGNPLLVRKNYALMSKNPPVPAALQTLLLICETDQQREELTHCYYATLGGDPSSPILELATLISAMAAAGRKNNGNGELAAHLADLKKSEALKASRAPEIRKCLEQLNRVQGDILKRLRTLPASPAGDDTWVKRLA